MSTKSSAAALLVAVFFAGVASALGALRVVEHNQRAERMEARRAYWDGQGRGESMRGERSGEYRGRRPDGRRGPRPEGFGRPPFSELAQMEMTARLSDELGLTEEQQAQLEAILSARRERAEEVMSEMLPLLRSQMDSLELEIGEILTEEQRASFESFRMSDMERFRRRGGNPFGPPGVQ